MKKLMMSIVLVLLAGCYDGFDGGDIQHYLIQQGSHYARLSNQALLQKVVISKVKEKSLTFKAVFGDGCAYKIDYEQINKLYGLSVGLKHHKYSARIGWMYNNEKELMDVYAYWYIDSVRDFVYLTSVPTHTWINYYVGVMPEGYVFIADGVEFVISGSIPDKVSYRLLPYFGGKYPAPHEMRLSIKEL